MLQIRLSKPASETGASAKPVPVDTVTVACPDHLVLADLPVAKCLGSPCATAAVKIVGRRSRRQLGERVHFCVRCDFPIAIYGRLSPCEHAFCLDCARSDSLCYLCYERVQKIQTIKMMEGIFICAAPQCLKSFLKKSDFESHINEIHANLVHPKKEQEGNESEAMSARKPSASESTVQAPPRPVFSPGSNSQVNDREDKIQRSQSRDEPPSRPVMTPGSVPPFSGQAPNPPSGQHPDSNQSHLFDRAAQNRFPQQPFDPQGQGGPQQDSVNPNSVLPPPQFGYPPYPSDGNQPFFGASYEMARPDSMPEAGPGQGSLLGFPPGPAGPMNYAQNYPQPWNMGPVSGPLEPPMVSQGTPEGFVNADPQGRGFFQGDYGHNVGILPSNVPPPAANKGADQRQGGNFVDPRDGKGVLAHQPLALPPPPPMPPPHLPQLQRGRSYDGNHDAPPGFGWQPDT
ncbi:E3 ubiquitin ligase involved in ubiquitination of E-cadherin complex [Handroanthus impetiginosus]|uniref:RING-type E3 ubiquitin transferase n=1 Tax=Handroanthus impetiginosus TaxID=429701 RepID=A0A2G9I536_9LAMI|nr:E3 ubiquitin ligase involved in ubiquitination of E-cadherin complex [Handroanthus impetiginosus]